MKLLIAAGLAGALLASAPFALAADNQAGTSLTPADAAGVWSLETQGHTVCRLDLGKVKAAAGFALRVPANCASALPQTPAAWRPTPHGMSMVGADGQVLIGFNRWSNSLLVSHASSGVDIQLRRGGPTS